MWQKKLGQGIFIKFNSILNTNQTSDQNSPTRFFRSRCEENVAHFLLLNTDWNYIHVLHTFGKWPLHVFRKGFYFSPYIMTSNNWNLQLLSFQKIYTLLEILWNMWPASSDYARLPFGVYWYLNVFIKFQWMFVSWGCVLHKRRVLIMSKTTNKVGYIIQTTTAKFWWL